MANKMERNQAEERAILAAWRWFVRNQDKFDLPFSTIVTKVRERCPHADVGRIQAEFARRQRQALQQGRWR
jgi:hypothetical protein